MSFKKKGPHIDLNTSITPSRHRRRHRHSWQLISIQAAVAVFSLIVFLFGVLVDAALASSRPRRVLQREEEKSRLSSMKASMMNNYHWLRSHRLQNARRYIERKCSNNESHRQSFIMSKDIYSTKHKLMHTSSSSYRHFSTLIVPSFLCFSKPPPPASSSSRNKKSISCREQNTKLLPMQFTRMRCRTQFSRNNIQESTMEEEEGKMEFPTDPSDETTVYESALNANEANNSKKSHNNNYHLNATQWFEQLLPEGYCVGVRMTLENVLKEKHKGNLEQYYQDDGMMNPSAQITTTATLHPEEWTWGQTNIASDASRTSYYLGRMALRSAIRSLLLSSPSDDDMNHHPSELLWEQIRSTPISKDGHGRPVLPETIVGSISHKGDCAVAVARFRIEDVALVGLLTRDEYSVQKLSDADRVSGAVNWKEECPISNEEEFNQESLSSNINRYGDSTIGQQLSGIGIDLERIDGKRGRRIQRKVLTEREQKELGRLEAIGISKGEEVMLRFSLKESVYKAMHPILCEYVGFQEAEITPLPNGTADVVLNLFIHRPMRYLPTNVGNFIASRPPNFLAQLVANYCVDIEDGQDVLSVSADEVYVSVVEGSCSVKKQ